MQKERDALQRVRAQLKETGKKSEQDHFKMNELQVRRLFLNALRTCAHAHSAMKHAEAKRAQAGGKQEVASNRREDRSPR